MTLSLLKIRLCETDRAAYGCAELVLDLEALKDLPADELEEIDAQLQQAAAALIPLLETNSLVARARRLAVWLALRQAGLSLDWEKCTPKILRTTFEVETQPGPPAGPSETSSEDAQPASS